MFISGRFQSVRTNETFTGGTTLVGYQQTDYVYDSHLWLTSLTTNYWQSVGQGQWQSRVLAQNVYGYDTLGQRLSNQITDSIGATRTETYAYDELNRLAAVNYGDGQTQGDPTNWGSHPGYTFDAMGNRSSKQDSVTGSESYGVNAANMLTSRTVGGNTQTYSNDLDGNTLTGGGRTNTWDSQNRLTQCVFGTTTSNYTYGADGLRRRSMITTGGTTTTTDTVLDASMFVRELRYNVSVQ